MTVTSTIEPIAEHSLAAYFREQITAYAQRLRPPPNEETCWYIGSMLARFGNTDQLFAYQHGRTDLRPLALLYGDAVEADSHYERCQLLQQLGDMALFLGAQFPERFTRRGIQLDYVAGMGGAAYDYLSGNARSQRHIFAELGAMFATMLEMVAHTCSRAAVSTEDDVLSLYRQWTSSGDPVAEERLRRLGVIIATGDKPH